MIYPKTEKELEIYFKLLELVESRKRKDMPYTLNYPHQDLYDKRYIQTKEEYLKLANKK